jgi:hypothetical protein
MGQVNVNPPPSEPVGEPAGSSGAGMILGIIIAIIVIAALVYFLVLGGAGTDTDDGGTDVDVTLPTDGGDGGTEPTEAPSSWRLVDLA